MNINIPTEGLDTYIKIAVEREIQRYLKDNKTAMKLLNLDEQTLRRALTAACKEWVEEHKDELVPKAIAGLQRSITARVVSDNVYRAFMNKIKEDGFEE